MVDKEDKDEITASQERILEAFSTWAADTENLSFVDTRKYAKVTADNWLYLMLLKKNYIETMLEDFNGKNQEVTAMLREFVDYNIVFKSEEINEDNLSYIHSVLTAISENIQNNIREQIVTTLTEDEFAKLAEGKEKDVYNEIFNSFSEREETILKEVFANFSDLENDIAKLEETKALERAKTEKKHEKIKDEKVEIKSIEESKTKSTKQFEKIQKIFKGSLAESVYIETMLRKYKIKKEISSINDKATLHDRGELFIIRFKEAIKVATLDALDEIRRSLNDDKRFWQLPIFSISNKGKYNLSQLEYKEFLTRKKEILKEVLDDEIEQRALKDNPTISIFTTTGEVVNLDPERVEVINPTAIPAMEIVIDNSPTKKEEFIAEIKPITEITPKEIEKIDPEQQKKLDKIRELLKDYRAHLEKTYSGHMKKSDFMTATLNNYLSPKTRKKKLDAIKVLQTMIDNPTIHIEEKLDLLRSAATGVDNKTTLKNNEPAPDISHIKKTLAMRRGLNLGIFSKKVAGEELLERIKEIIDKDLEVTNTPKPK